MTSELSTFAARLREFIFISVAADVRRLTSDSGFQNEPPHVGCYEDKFNALALELFALQFKHNSAYRKICLSRRSEAKADEARRATPQTTGHWSRIPAVPPAAFKELDMTSLAPGERTAVFHSSGTTEQKPSRHFHCADSLATYEAALWSWFKKNCRLPITDCRLAILTPPTAEAPHSSLVQMFEVARTRFNQPATAFLGRVEPDGAWALDFDAALESLAKNSKPETRNPKLLLGTAFSFVHLLDFLAEKNLRLTLPPGSRVMETGGYKGRSRSLPKAELHA